MTIEELSHFNGNITATRVREILAAHGIDDMEEFVRDNGNFAVYDCQAVFAWLGY